MIPKDPAGDAVYADFCTLRNAIAAWIADQAPLPDSLPHFPAMLPLALGQVFLAALTSCPDATGAVDVQRQILKELAACFDQAPTSWGTPQ